MLRLIFISWFHSVENQTTTTTTKQATVGRQEKVLDEFGGEKGIKELAAAAASAGDATAAVAAAQESAEAAKAEADAAKTQAEEAQKEAEDAKKGAASSEEEAGRLAADKVRVCGRVCVCFYPSDLLCGV